MICPYSGLTCQKGCRPFGCHFRGNMGPAQESPKPTLADIERLVDDHETAIVRDAETRSMETCCEVVAARAALLAAIRAYGEG